MLTFCTEVNFTDSRKCSDEEMFATGEGLELASRIRVDLWLTLAPALTCAKQHRLYSRADGCCSRVTSVAEETQSFPCQSLGFLPDLLVRWWRLSSAAI